MKNLVKLLALMLAVSMVASGCGSSSAGSAETADESQVDETAEDESEDDDEDDEDEEDIPDVDYSEGLDDDGMLLDEMDVDGVILPEYKNVEFEKAKVTGSEDDVQDAITTILENYAEQKEIKDREVKDGDTVNIDYVGTVDGVAFEGGDSQGQGYDLVIGSHSFIDTFEEQLIGSKPGDQVTVKVTFPENYGKDDLNGKEAEFATTINYIVEKEIPELTDAFVAENLKESYGFETVADLEKDIRDTYDASARTDGVWEWLMENTKFENEPEAMTDVLLENYMNSIRANVQMYGISMDEYLEYMNVSSEEELLEQQRADALELAHRYVITKKLSELEGIVVDDAAMEEYFGENDYSSLYEQYGDGYVKVYVRMYLIAKKLVEMGTVK